MNTMTKREVINWLATARPAWVCTSNEYKKFLKAIEIAIEALEIKEKIEKELECFNECDRKKDEYYDLAEYIGQILKKV